MLRMSRSRHDLQINLNGHAALRHLKLFQQVRQCYRPIQFPRLAVNDDIQSRSAQLFTFTPHFELRTCYCRRSTFRAFHGPMGRISVAWATPEAVAAFTHGNVNAATWPVFASAT